MKNKIAETLKEQGKTKSWLARKMNVTYVTINNWCQGRGIDEFKLARVAKVLEVEPKTLEA